jgi:hypothetical protein
VGLKRSSRRVLTFPAGHSRVSRSRLPSLRLSLRLGRRLSASRSQISALVILGLVAAWVAVVLAALLAAPGVLSEQKAVADRTAVTTSNAPTGTAIQQTFFNWKDKFRIRRVVIASGPQTPPPPGLMSPVRPGQIWESPALRDAIAADADLAAVTSRRPTGISVRPV